MTLNRLHDLLNYEIRYKMKQVIQVLKLVSNILIPLTLIAGNYEMNFENMPELRTYNGYFIIIEIVLSIFMSWSYSYVGIGGYRSFIQTELKAST